MCFFACENQNHKSVSYYRGVTKFECGACPECLQKRSSQWALRAVYEANKYVHNCMITLTYDTFKYDKYGNCLGENPVNPDLLVDKTHIQKFMKRLRKHFSGQIIKYIACAEYGSTTHRAHYHLLLFNCHFSDFTFYKLSKRGNPIYMSKTLTDLWGQGICTIDSINVHSAVARYCTKYCAKSRSLDTFMLFSQGLGLDGLLEDFNGKFYMVEGRKHPIPRLVWHHYISDKYKNNRKAFSPKYVNRDPEIPLIENDRKYLISYYLRKNYFKVRDKDPVYKSYIRYWKELSALYESVRPSVFQRIRNLDERKFARYKTASLDCLSKRFNFIPYVTPDYKQLSRYSRWFFQNYGFEIFHLPFRSRPNTANDTVKSIKLNCSQLKVIMKGVQIFPYSYFAIKKRPFFKQISFFS